MPELPLQGIHRHVAMVNDLLQRNAATTSSKKKCGMNLTANSKKLCTPASTGKYFAFFFSPRSDFSHLMANSRFWQA